MIIKKNSRGSTKGQWLSIFFASLAPAALDDHVLVLLEHHVGRLVEVEHRQSGQLGRGTAGHRDQLGVEAVGEGLENNIDVELLEHYWPFNVSGTINSSEFFACSKTFRVQSN